MLAQSLATFSWLATSLLKLRVNGRDCDMNWAMEDSEAVLESESLLSMYSWESWGFAAAAAAAAVLSASDGVEGANAMHGMSIVIELRR